MIHKMAVGFLQEFILFVYQYLIDTGVSAERNVVCDSRIKQLIETFAIALLTFCAPQKWDVS
jgi:hypothetical protein